MKKLFLLLLLLVNSAFIATAQVETNYYASESENPIVQSLNIKEPTRVHTLPSIRQVNDKCRKDNTDTLNIYRFGQDIDVSLTIDDGNWEECRDGRVWSLSVESRDASSLTFIINSLHLEGESKLYIFNEDKSVVYGPVTPEVLIYSSYLYTDIIPGSEASIYLYEPTENIGTSTISINKIIRGINSNNREYNISGLDPACYPTFVDFSDGVCMINLPNGSAYFGTLLMTTNNSFIPYVLTTYSITDYTADQLGFRFRVRKEQCSGSQQATVYTYTGAQLRASWSVSDFALLEMLSDVSKQPKISWIGWDKSTNTPTFSTSFLEWGGNIKMFFDNGSPTSVTIHNGSTGSEMWRVTNYGYEQCNPIKGSPLLNQNKRVVGQFNSYYINATYNTLYDYFFNKFNQSWNGGGTISTRLSNWLDPTNTGNTTQNSALPPYITGADHICTSEVYTLSNCPPEASVVWELSGSNINFLSISQNSPSNNQCTITRLADSPTKYDLIAKVYRNSIYQYSIIKNGLSVGTPALGMCIIPEAPDGTIGCWSTDMDGNTFTIEESCLWPYDRFEANLYRMDSNFNITQLVRSWNNFNVTNPYVPPFSEGWYLFQLRGYNDCGYSDWLEQEVEFIDLSDCSLRLEYNASSHTITIAENNPNSGAKKQSSNTCELQLWRSNNTNLVKKTAINSFPSNISLEGIPNGFYIVRVVYGDNIYSRKIAIR